MPRRANPCVVNRADFFIASANNGGQSDAAMFSATCAGSVDFTAVPGKNFI